LRVVELLEDDLLERPEDSLGLGPGDSAPSATAALAEAHAKPVPGFSVRDFAPPRLRPDSSCGKTRTGGSGPSRARTTRVQGVPPARQGDPHDHTAAIRLRTRAARGDHRSTNKVEAYNAFSAWLRFGYDAIERNDPAEQEKIIKVNSLLANCVIFHTALDMTAVLRQLHREG
jgi:hypothetical protein